MDRVNNRCKGLIEHLSIVGLIFKKRAIGCAFILFTLGCQIVGAQENRTIDSLQSELAKVDKKKQFDVLLDLFIAYSEIDYKKALSCAEQASKLGFELGDSAQIVKSGRMMGNILLNLGRNSDAIAVYDNALSLAIRNKYDKEMINILNSMALAYMNRGNYDRALDYHFRSLILREEKGDKRSISISLSNIGLVYFRLLDYHEALNYYLKALDMKKSIGDRYNLERLYTNIGLCHLQLHDVKSAIGSFKDAIALCEPNCTDNVQKECAVGLGNAYLENKKYEEARISFKRALEIATRQNDTRNQAEILIGLSQVSFEADPKMGEALELVDKAFQIADKAEYAQLIRIYWEYARIYKAKSDFKHATEFQWKYIQLRDSMNEGQLTNIARTRTEYEERENARTIASQKQILDLKDEAIGNHRILIFLIGIVAILFVGLTIILYKTNRQKQRINLLLGQKVRARTQTLEDSLVELQRSHTEQSQFLIKTSRDLRGPLMTMKGLFNIISADAESPEAMREDLGKLRDTAENLVVILSMLECKTGTDRKTV